MAKRSEQTLHQRKYTEGKKVYERCSTSLVRETQMKTRKRYPCTSVTTEWLEKLNIRFRQGAEPLDATALLGEVRSGTGVGESL